MISQVSPAGADGGNRFGSHPKRDRTFWGFLPVEPPLLSQRAWA